MERAAAVGATALALVATLGAVDEITMGSGNGDPSGSAAGTVDTLGTAGADADADVACGTGIVIWAGRTEAGGISVRVRVTASRICFNLSACFCPRADRASASARRAWNIAPKMTALISTTHSAPITTSRALPR